MMFGAETANGDSAEYGMERSLFDKGLRRASSRDLASSTRDVGCATCRRAIRAEKRKAYHIWS